MSKFLVVPLVGLLLAASASTAHAATELSVSTGSSPGSSSRSVQLQVYAAFGAALDVSISGADDGVLTVTDPGGVEITAWPGETICTVVSPTTATCGSVAEPVTYVVVGGGALVDTIDLTGLAAQKGTAGAWAPAGIIDADGRMRGVYVQVGGGPGADVVRGGAAGASYQLGPGDDTVIGGSADEILRAETTDDGDDTFDGGAGYDTASYSRRTAGVTASISDTTTTANGDTAAGEADRFIGVEAISGSSAADTLSINGVVGGLGTLLGNAGNDTLIGGPSTDKLTGGDGVDELRGEGGDDRLVDNRKPGELQGHLHGGAGDDELVQRRSFDASGPGVADGAPTCGDGTDILRADHGLDDGVTNVAGPADCEFLGNSTYSSGTISGDARVGQTVTAAPPNDVLGTPLAGRFAKATWELCSPAMACDTRQTTGLELLLTPADEGKLLYAAQLHFTEPASQAPRWIEERAKAPARDSGSSIFARRLEVVLGVEAPKGAPPEQQAQPQGLRPSIVARPDASAITKSLAAAFGKAPRIARLKKASMLKFSAPAGATVAVRLTTKRGKKVVVLASGSAKADPGGKVAVRLVPTGAGRRAATGRKSRSVLVTTTATNAGGASSATVRLKLKAK